MIADISDDFRLIASVPDDSLAITWAMNDQWLAVLRPATVQVAGRCDNAMELNMNTVAPLNNTEGSGRAIFASTDITVVEAEPRVLDTRLAAALGMKRATNIREKILRNRVELEGFGPVHETRALVDRPQGGAVNVQTYYLNEPQALLLCMWARTPTAAAVRKQLIEVFMAWRLAQQQPQPDTISVRAHERRTSTRIDDAYRLSRSVDRLEQLADRIQPSAPTLIYVNDEPVVVDVQDFALKPNTEAVVIHDDGSLAIDRVVMVDDHRGARSAMGEWAGNTRPGVIVMGRVVSRMTRRLAAAVQPVVEHQPARRKGSMGAVPVFKDAILDGLRAGLTARQVAEQTGASIWTVRHWQSRRKRAA